MRSTIRAASGVVMACVLSACQTIGVGTVQRDRLDYGAAIADSWKEQTLLNIVKLRYFDTPAFLDVSSVISSYQLQTDVRFAREVFPSDARETNRTFGLSGTYTDRPTISYAPLSGEKFVNGLLRPIPPQAIFAMIFAGHQADYILRATVRAMNDVHNLSAAPSRARGEDPAFTQVIEALRRIQQAGALGMRVEAPAPSNPGTIRIEIPQPATGASRAETRPGRAETTWIFFREGADDEIDRDIRLVRKTLGIAPDAREIRLAFGSLRGSGSELALLTRSIMEILLELSAGVEVPAAHVREGRARPLTDASGGTLAPGYPLARVLVSDTQPQDAYIAVRYRNLWFWVDDRDLGSKRAFTFLRMFSSIAETGVTPQLPVLTIPAN